MTADNCTGNQTSMVFVPYNPSASMTVSGLPNVTACATAANITVNFTVANSAVGVPLVLNATANVTNVKCNIKGITGEFGSQAAMQNQAMSAHIHALLHSFRVCNCYTCCHASRSPWTPGMLLH